MDIPKRSYWHTSVATCPPFLQTSISNRCLRAPRSALQNVSNGQSVRGLSSFDRQRTPPKKCLDVLGASAKRMHLSIRRDFSKSHGDLSKLRPKSPPIHAIPHGMCGLSLSPGNYVDDTQNFLSPSYNRQARQAIPSDWMNSGSGRPSPTLTQGSGLTGQQIHQSPLCGRQFSGYVEAEPATIPIQGLSSGYIQPLDFCVPVTRSHPGDGDQRHDALHGDIRCNLAVEHVNISTAWNGLSDVDANELFRVHQAFVSTLEKMLANELWQIYQQLQQQDSTGIIRPIHTLFSAGIIRGISFCRDQLVSELAKALYSSNESAAKAKSGFLRLYLVATDALVQYQEDGSRDTSITIRMRYDPSSLRAYPVVDAAWVPDSLLFEGLDECPQEGQRFSIVPKYYSKSAFRPTRFPENVKYSIESEEWHSGPSWLVWNDKMAGFEGIVPFYSEANGYNRRVANSSRGVRKSMSHILKIIVQAVLVDDNGSSVRYERILRVHLTINVVPWYINGNSREKEERFSVPKAYQDRRLVSTTHRFAHQAHNGNLPYPGQPPSGFPKTKEAHPHTPTECVHTGQVESRNIHSAMSSSATETGTKDSDSFCQTQIQTYLVAKCAQLTRDLEDVKGQVMMSGPSGQHPMRMVQASDLQESTNHTYCTPFDHHTGQSKATSRSSVPRIPHLTIPLSPSLHGRPADSQLGPIARLSALPPPAIGHRARPMSDTQMTDGGTPAATRTGCHPTPELGHTPQSAGHRDTIFRNPFSAQESGSFWRLSEHASLSSGKMSAAPVSSRQDSNDFLTSSVVKGELATPSTSGKRSHERRAKSSLEKTSPSKCPEGSRRQPQQEIGAHSAELGEHSPPLLESDKEASRSPTQWSDGIFYNSFGPLRNLRSSDTIPDEDLPASQASERDTSTIASGGRKHRKLERDCCVITNIVHGDKMARKPSSISSGLDDSARTAQGLCSNSFSKGCKGQVHRCLSPSASSFLPHACTNSSGGSRSTSSDVEFIVERDPRAREVSRQEQAKLWRLLSQSDSQKETQLRPVDEEVRLSEDEKRAIDEALQRSIDDLAEGFDDIFLEDSSESNSGSGDL